MKYNNNMIMYKKKKKKSIDNSIITVGYYTNK